MTPAATAKACNAERFRALAVMSAVKDIKRGTVPGGINVSRSHSRNGSSSSRQESKDEILSVADLTALPRFRAILLASGAPATMIETIPWMNGPHAQKVKDSHAAKECVEREPVSVAARNPWTDGDRA